jgi:hypothetical protein
MWGNAGPGWKQTCDPTVALSRDLISMVHLLRPLSSPGFLFPLVSDPMPMIRKAAFSCSLLLVLMANPDAQESLQDVPVSGPCQNAIEAAIEQADADHSAGRLRFRSFLASYLAGIPATVYVLRNPEWRIVKDPISIPRGFDEECYRSGYRSEFFRLNRCAVRSSCIIGLSIRYGVPLTILMGVIVSR